MACHFIVFDGEKVLIPECYGSLHRDDLKMCTCVKRKKSVGVRVKGKLLEKPVVLTIDNFSIRKATNNDHFDSYLYDWCDKYGIKVEQPFNKVEQRYDTMIITLRYAGQVIAFQERFMSLVNLLESEQKDKI